MGHKVFDNEYKTGKKQKNLFSHLVQGKSSRSTFLIIGNKDKIDKILTYRMLTINFHVTKKK